MGRGRNGNNKGRTQRKHFKEGRENVWKRSKPSNEEDDVTKGPHWEPFITQNLAFEDYYKEQGIVPEHEWDTFMAFLRKPLPAAFRINASSQFCSDIRSQLENDFAISLQGEVSFDGDEVEPIRPLPWYPHNLAWHSNFSRKQIRKNQTLERFHEFLKLENEIGNITRQEAVSMIPPLFLDVKPDHFVLDMCAAPGSKTFQLLEIIYQSTKTGSLPNGMIIANDLDVQRCNLLIHQTKRMCTANLIVTNHEAQHFPYCRPIKTKFNSTSIIETKPEASISQLAFDRVLCDVPCSGDGTLRKAPDIWRKWNSGNGNGLHSLQIQIAMRGLALLKDGGRMVYSTCAMNPVEDEAVVAEILRRCKGSVELVDVSSELPQLVRRPGLKKWKVRDKGEWLGSYKDVRKLRRNGILPSMFPSGRDFADQTENGGDDKMDEPTEVESECKDLDEEVSDLPLERCMRIVPHDQNCGAFFIAVLQKNSALPAIEEKTPSVKVIENSKIDEPREELSNQVIEDVNGSDIKLTNGADEQVSNAASEIDLVANDPTVPCLQLEENNSEEITAPDEKKADTEKVGGKRKLQTQGKWKGVDPVVFFKDETVINSIKTFYGIDDNFPFEGHLITRNAETNHVKRIYYISDSVKDALELNLQAGQQLKIASVGIKMFERQTAKEGAAAPCLFRISSEGLPLLLPHITKQILFATIADFKHLLQYKTIKFPDFVDPEFGEKASNLMLGCCVVVLKEETNDLSDPVKVDFPLDIAIGCWKGRASLCVLVNAIDCQELLERLVFRLEPKKDSEKNGDNNIVSDLEPKKDSEKNGDNIIASDEVLEVNGVEETKDKENIEVETN
ncbi:hypothetical protein ACFE04_020635 [Oxalis oulophora]